MPQQTNFQRKLANAKGAITLELYERAVIASAKRKVTIAPIKVKRATPMLDYASKAKQRKDEKETRRQAKAYNASRPTLTLDEAARRLNENDALFADRDIGGFEKNV